jgi:hypothetical protein
MRIIIAAIVGGIVMFVWGAASHMLTPIGEMGLKTTPNEAPIVSALQSNLNEPGFYFIPGMDMHKEVSAEEQAAWTARYEKGPNAIVIYQPTGETPMSPKQLGTEFISNILAALVVALLMTWTVGSFAKRVAMATLVGLTAWLSIDVSYWNWYHFPIGMITGELLEQVIGWLLTGFVMAFILRNRTLV